MISSETKPLLIAHRGLLSGPDKTRENTVKTLVSARQQGYDVEIDVWYHENSWWLGHDGPLEPVDISILQILDRGTYLGTHHAWIHAKSIQTLYQLRKMRWEGHVFFHENDPAVLTSSGYLWTFVGQELTPLSICVMPELTDSLENCRKLSVYAFCTDYIHDIEQRLR